MLGLKLNHVSKRGHWCWIDDKSLSDQLWSSLPTHVCVSQPRWLHTKCLTYLCSSKYTSTQCYKNAHAHIEGLAQDCNNSIANALELLQSCAKPSICCHTPFTGLVSFLFQIPAVRWPVISQTSRCVGTWMWQWVWSSGWERGSGTVSSFPC